MPLEPSGERPAKIEFDMTTRSVALRDRQNMRYPVIKETPVNDVDEEEREPKKSTGKTPYTGNFTWVNKSSNNVRRKTKEDTLTIRSHVQRRFVPWDKQNRVRPTRTATLSTDPTLGNLDPAQSDSHNVLNTPVAPLQLPDSTLPGLKSLEPNADAIETSSTANPQPRQELVIVMENRPQKHHHKPKHSTRARQPLIKREEHNAQPTSRSTAVTILPRPTSPVGGGNHDPFNSSSLFIDARRYESLSVLGSFVMNTIWPSLRTRQSKVQAYDAWAIDCRGGVGNETYLHGLLASASIVTSRLVPDGSALSRQLRLQSYTHQAECLKRIRQSLDKSKVDEQLVLAIWSTISYYMLDGDLNTSQMHLVGLKKVIDQLGGLHLLPEFLQRKILFWDAAAAGLMFSIPVFSPADWRPPSLQSLFATIKDADSLNQLRASIDEVKSQPLSKVITERLRPNYVLHREAITVRTCADKLDPGAETVAMMDRWHYTWAGTLELSDLIVCNEIEADIRRYDGDIGAELQTKLELSLCLTVRYMHRFIARHNKEDAGCLSYDPLKLQLEQLKLSYFAYFDNSTHEAVLWILFVGACGEEIINRSLPMEQAHLYFTSTFLDAVVELDKTSLSELQKSLSNFIYDASHLDPILIALLHRLDEGQSHDSKLIEAARVSMEPLEFAMRNSHLDTLGGRSVLTKLSTKTLHPVLQ